MVSFPALLLPTRVLALVPSIAGTQGRGKLLHLRDCNNHLQLNVYEGQVEGTAQVKYKNNRDVPSSESENQPRGYSWAPGRSGLDRSTFTSRVPRPL